MHTHIHKQSSTQQTDGIFPKFDFDHFLDKILNTDQKEWIYENACEKQAFFACCNVYVNMQKNFIVQLSSGTMKKFR